ncbi:MAG: leukotoxin LktA family filamentous adhesin, partial [Candidatus Riflebacteria bacterium]|nr:leukotoxin LktA family filamentous adhesin [Candidatus Riflebacteria bacterium]
MKFCRRIARQILFERQKADKRHIKELRKGSVHNLLTSSLQKILLSATGLTMLVSPLFGASQSKITALGNQTTIDYNDATKTHTINTSLKKNGNAFNAFKDFTLHSNEIANLKFPNDTKNLINFVRNKIDISGTLNAVKNSKIGGNLYFLSSEGLILSKSGVINAGAFYAMTPTKGFMDKFIGNGDSLDLSRVDTETGYIVDRKISNYNVAYDKGVTINPYGEIQIEGTINAANGIGLYAGGYGEGNNANKKGLYIGKDAVLNTLDADGFSSLVNVSGLSFPQATDIVEDAGEIELVSVQDNADNSSKILELATGYTSFITASAAAKIESYGDINSRSDVSITAYASNGHVKNINKDGEKDEFDQVANLANIYSTVTVNGNITADGDISIDATSDNINELKTPNLAALGLELMGATFSAFPLNIDANVLLSKTASNVDIKKDAKLIAEGAIEIAAITNSTEVSGAKTSGFVTTKAANSNLNWLPIVATAVNISEAKSTVNFDGEATSNMAYEAPVGDKRKKSITITSESNSDFSVDTKASSSNTQSKSAIAISIGKHNNSSTLTLGKNAKLEGINDIEVSSTTNSDNSVCAESSLKKTAYVVPAIAVSIFDSDATLNVESSINANKQKGEFSLTAENNINSDELVADAGIPASPWPWQEAAGDAKKKAMDTLYEKLNLASRIQGVVPQPQAAKFSIAGAAAYGGGKHSSNLNIKPGATLKTLGDLSLSSNMNIMDTKYDVGSDIYLCEDHQDAKFETSLAFLYSDYDYSSTILVDDSSGSKTQISGKNVSIESQVYQPYRRPEAMVDDLKKAWKKVCDYFSASEHSAKFKAVGDSFDELFTLVKDPSDMTSAGNSEQAGKVWRNVTNAFDSLYELIKNEDIVGQDSIIGRLINTVKKALEFKEYSNYVNYTVSSSSNSTEASGNAPFSISGSIFYGDNTSKSNVFIGKNAIINGTSDNSIDISSKADVTTTTMVGGIPVLYQNNQAKNSIGGSAIIHNNDSESNILIANGASIGNSNIDEITVNATNLFKPIEIVMGTSSITNGFNAMGSVLNGNSYSNIRIDDGVDLAADTIKLDSYNNTEAANIVGAITISEKKGLGVGLALTFLDKETQVLIQDNDAYWQKVRKDLGLTGTTTSSKKKADISANIFEAVAKTTGTINTVGVAGGVAIDDKSKYDKFTGKANMFNDFLSGSTIDSGTDYLKYKLLGKILGVNNQQQNVPDQEQQDENDDNAQQQIQQNQQNQDTLKLQLNGSAAANTIENTTKVAIENSNLDFEENDDALFNASAINSAHHLSFAGAAGIMAQGGNGNGASVGVDGAVAVNKIDNTTETLINKSSFSEAKQVNALAINGGESIVAGLGLQVIVSSQQSQSTGSGAANGSVNLIDNTVSAKIIDTNSSSEGSDNKTNMAVTAYEADTQVTGGVSAAVGKQKGAVGVSIDVAKINNVLTSEINGGNMTEMKNVEVNTLQASTIVNAGIAAAVSAGVDQSSFGFSGSGVYTELTNTSNANIKNAKITGDAISARAQDVRRNDKGVKTYEDNLVRNGKNLDFIDKDGKEFYTGLDTATGTTELGKLVDDRKGSFIFTGSISGAYGGTAVGLGAAINEVDNTFNVNVDKSTIKANKFDANAISYTKAIALGIGASISTESNKGSGVGSAAWNSIKNEANVKFSNNTIKSGSLNLKSLNDSSLVGVGGQFSASKGYAAVGASVAYNSIENTANSEIYGGSVTGVATNTSKLSVNSENTSNIWGVSVSIEAADKFALGGTLVLNEIENNATSAVGSSTVNTKLASLKELNVLATDSADIKGLSGAVTASKKVSVGGAVTVNHIDGETAAKLNRANFNVLNTNIKAYSESNNLSLALGCGGAGTFAFDGAAVNNDIFRDVYVNVDKSTIDNTNATLDSSAIAIGNTGSLAAVVLGAGKVSIGAGVSVNRMGGKVQTTFDGNNFKLKNMSATSYSNQDITTIGIAGSGAGVSISGSIAYNAIQYDTIAEVLNSTLISATNNIAVKALSDDTIKNYAGVLSLGIGIPTEAAGAGGIGGGGAVPGVGAGAAENRNKFLKLFDTISGGLKSGHDKMGTLSSKMGGVGVGVSVSVNKIDGKTNAKVSGGNVTAQGKDANDKVKIKSQIDDSDINNAYMDSSTVDIKGSLADKRKETTKTGLVIDSSSTHTAKSFLASVSGGGKAAVNANVNVNYVGGETNSIFENATVNKGLTGKTAGNVNVNANDYTNTAGFIGNVSFGGNAGVGLSADTNKVNRTIISKVSGIKDGSVANNLEVKANSKQGISSVVAGLAASLKVGVAGNVDVVLLNSTTKALVENSKISVNSLDVLANHYARAHELAVAAGIGVGTAGVGAAVVVNNDINTVSAGVASSTINANSGSNGAFKVNSKNDDDFETVSGAGGAGMYAGVAGAVAVNYMENNVETNVSTSTFGTSTNRAGSIEIKSKDISKQVSKGGSVGIGGYAGVGAVVEVNTLDGQTNTNILNSKMYATNNIDLGASEQRDSSQFAVSVSAGMGGVGANVLVINSGKKLDVKDSGSNDANNDIDSAMNMADTAASSDYLGDNYYQGAFTADEIATIFKGTPSYTASKDGKAVTLTKIDKSTIDSKSGKITSLTTATGSLTLSNNGGAGGIGAVMGTFGYIYDNKNVVTTISNSNISANKGIDYTSSTYGNSDLSMFQGSAGLGDYSGAFAYVNLSGKNSVGVAGSTLTNKNGVINLKSLDYA